MNRCVTSPQVAVQFATIATVFGALDAVCAQFDVTLPAPAVAAVFFALSIRSRVFSPLDNSRRARAAFQRPKRPSDGFP